MRAPKRPAAVLDHRPLDTAAIYEVLPSHAPETTRVVGQRHEQVVDAARKQLLLLAKQSSTVEPALRPPPNTHL